jgi:hypothetical protein
MAKICDVLLVENFFVEIFWRWLERTALNIIASATRKCEYKVRSLSRATPCIEFTVVKTCIL